MEHQYSFEKLHVWQDARIFVSAIYKITQKFPQEERFGLIPQIRRASVSVTANIAEGSSRTSKKDQAHFSQIAYGSLLEVLNHLYIALDLKYIESPEFKKFRENIYSLTKQLSSLRKTQLNS